MAQVSGSAFSKSPTKPALLRRHYAPQMLAEATPWCNVLQVGSPSDIDFARVRVGGTTRWCGSQSQFASGTPHPPLEASSPATTERSRLARDRRVKGSQAAGTKTELHLAAVESPTGTDRSVKDPAA